MKQFNKVNKSQTVDVSDDTVAFMLSNGFTTDGNWYKWYQSRHQQAKQTPDKA
ncbi:MAG: hypothetical protein HC780_20985 [Leptolyngbyaceae cyanobacterium CSU_1_3]|nr:hypothetical protein [Leptolyngbyaceae cyanobacterium CSU_1_3]